MKLETLFTERLVLEGQGVQHSDELFEGFQDLELYRFIKRQAPVCKNKFEAGICLIENRLLEDHKEMWLNWVMREQTSCRLVGQVEASLEVENGSCYLAYTTFKEFWKMGYAKEACLAVVKHLFEVWKVSKIIVEMDVRNLASVALAESLGAKRVAFNAKVQMIGSEWSDEYRYELEKIF